jgi:hypothetical protein
VRRKVRHALFILVLRGGIAPIATRCGIPATSSIIDSMHLEPMLREIEPNGGILHDWTAPI